MNLSRIMTNIYGENSSQSFDKVVLQGGSKMNRKPKLRYIDQVEEQPQESPQTAYFIRNLNIARTSYGSSGGLAGGAVPIVDSPMYSNDAGLDEFIKTFYLYYHFSHLKRNALIVIPTAEELKACKSELDSKLKAANIAPGSVDASKFASKEPLKFKRYIFDVYGGNDNEKYDYRIDYGFPEVTNDLVLRRTNRLSEALFFQFKDKDNILASTSPKMEKPTKLKYVATCSNFCFIVKGELPGGKSKQAGLYTVSGGAKKSLVKRFEDAVEQSGTEQGAYKFISAVGLSAISRGAKPGDVAKRLAKYYSGDFLHSAMSIVAENIDDPNEFGDVDDVKSFSKSDHNKMHKMIIDAYQPKHMSVDMGKVSNAVKSIYRKSKGMHGGRASFFVKSVGKMYGNLPKNVFVADVGTAIAQDGSSSENVRYAVKVMKAISDIYNGCGEHSGPCTCGRADCPECSKKGGLQDETVTNAVYNAMSTRPFIGIHARGYVPMLVCKSSKPSVFGCVAHSSGACGCGKPRKAFDEEQPEGKAFSFRLEENDDEPVEEVIEVVETPVEAEPDDHTGEDVVEPKNPDDAIEDYY